jgi:RNA polymerase sigma-70 factor (ECF subfamily)
VPARRSHDDEKRSLDSSVTSPMEETVALPSTLAVRIEDIVHAANGRVVLLDQLVEAAFAAHERELFTYALRATRDADASADLVQESFLRLIAELRNGRPPDDVRPWLYRVLTNLIVSRARRRSIVGRWLAGFHRSEETSPPPELMAIAGETGRNLERAISLLPADARTALSLAARGFDGPEIAERIGRSQAATRTLLCRARKQVRASLDEQEPG